MRELEKKIVTNISYTFLANCLSTIISIVLTLIVPKILGVREYSYWQLYCFYGTYIGFFHLGWADGIYLRYGGKTYDSLDKRKFSSQFWLLTILEFLFSVLIGAAVISYIADFNKRIVLFLVACNCVIVLPRTLLQYIFQTSGRIKEYAENLILEKIIYFCCVVFFLLKGITTFKILLMADLIAKIISFIALTFKCKEIAFPHRFKVKDGIKEAKKNIDVGSKLMFANIAGLLLTGIVRFAIESYWDIETFGKVSLTLTLSNLMMVFISAISIALFPLLKNVSGKEMYDFYIKGRKILMLILMGTLVFYYPIKVLLSKWLPQYEVSLHYMALLFPLCIFECRMSMLINTYLKAFRKENEIMKFNWLAVALTVVLTVITVYFYSSLTGAVLVITIMSAFRTICLEKVLTGILKINIKKENMIEISLIAIFMWLNWNYSNIYSFIIFALLYGCYAIWQVEILYNVADK